MKTVKTIVFSMIASIGVGMPAIGANIIDEDFDSDTSGSLPTGALFAQHNLAPFGRIEVTGNGAGQIADPFGGVGNKSMVMVDDANFGVPAVSFVGTQADHPAPGLTEGTLSFNLYMDNDPNDPSLDNSLLDVRMGSGEFNGALVNNDPAVWLQFVHASGNTNASLTIHQGANGGSYQIDNPAGLSSNTNHLIEIDFFSDQTFGIKIDGAAVSHLGNTSFSWGNFGFGTASEIHLMNFQSDGATTGNRVFVDNLVLAPVPEPASLALALIGGGFFLMGRCRR